MRKALEIPADALTFRQAVFLALELMKAASPVLAKHFDAVPNVLAAFEVVLECYAPDVIREAVVRMMRSMKRETRDVIPDAPRLADYCEDINAERRAARAQREAQARRIAEEEAQAKERARRAALSPDERRAEDERIAQRLAELNRIIADGAPIVRPRPAQRDRVYPSRTRESEVDFEARKAAAIRSLTA